MSLPINLEELLRSNRIEGSRLEFKESWNQVTVGGIFRTICAFANDYDNLGGGYIVMGVAEEHGVIKKPVKHICPKKDMSFVVGGDFEAGRRGGDQVRGTKYEVRSEGVRRNKVARV